MFIEINKRTANEAEVRNNYGRVGRFKRDENGCIDRMRNNCVFKNIFFYIFVSDSCPPPGFGVPKRTPRSLYSRNVHALKRFTY